MDEDLLTEIEARDLLGLSPAEFSALIPREMKVYNLIDFGRTGRHYRRTEIEEYRRRLALRESMRTFGDALAPEVLPETLYRTRRALCPACGAPHPLSTAEPRMTCPFCGAESVVERRLRKNEPEVAGAPRTWSREEDPPTCPGCAGTLELAGMQTIQRCRHCGGECKIERRMRRRDPVPIAGPENAETSRLLDRLAAETDLIERVLIARRLDNRGDVNATLARRLPAILEIMRDADSRLGHALGQLLCKLLCSEDRALRDAVVRAVEPHLVDLNGPRALLFMLGMGSGVCLKPLLDAAEHAARAGAIDRACTALWGVNYLFERNYGEHGVLGEIVLYRLMYATGPVLAWALRLVRGRLGFDVGYTKETLSRFIEDCARERPSLVPELREGATSESSQATEADLQWKEGIRRAVEVYDGQREGLSALIRLIDGATPLMLASAKGDLVEIRRLLDAGADPNARVGEGRTALMSAAICGDIETARLLLARGADPRAANARGETVLQFANTCRDNEEMIRLLSSP